MSNLYVKLKERQQEQFNKFPNIPGTEKHKIVKWEV